MERPIPLSSDIPATPPPLSNWKRLRHRAEAALVRLLAWFVPRLPRDRCRRLGNMLGEFAYRLDSRGRAVALDNLRCALGVTGTAAREIARASYRNFACTILDLFWSPALVRPENRHWLRVCTGKNLPPSNEGAVMLTLHFGNWEWASLALPVIDRPSLAVAENFKNPRLTSIFNFRREITGQTIIPQEFSVLRMLKAVRRGGTAALLSDLTFPPGQMTTVVRAFGLEISASVLHAIMALRGKAHILPLLALPDADGGCTIHFPEVIPVTKDDTEQTLAQKCWDYFEPHIRANPGLWLWPYKHFRYRPRGADRDYPSYANESGAFEKLRSR